MVSTKVNVTMLVNVKGGIGLVFKVGMVFMKINVRGF